MILGCILLIIEGVIIAVRCLGEILPPYPININLLSLMVIIVFFHFGIFMIVCGIVFLISEIKKRKTDKTR